MCCLPLISAPQNLRYDNVSRVLIVQFMDAYSLDVRALKKSCIHFAQADGRMIPFESFNLLYREASRLKEIQAHIRNGKDARESAARAGDGQKTFPIVSQ